MTLSELAETLDVPPRQIRFLVAEGILPPANKTGRAADAYDNEHLSRARRYLGLHRLGMKPGSIKVLMAFDDAVPVLQEGGVELRVAQDVSPQSLDIDDVLEKVKTALEAYVGKETQE
ncbi:helix-turn-helix domain-containing protein [Tropicimonas sp. IMCC6043]|uniref:helix-turn-helix domain-containing protein n=1 Tax=Tropicimonas sp. IMCC6043 TaxID=2510645 RepID=UPI0013ECF1D6|nr:helix-turn-helix domain-containing protein [Tropicimonas sp. IMCC6043]